MTQLSIDNSQLMSSICWSYFLFFSLSTNLIYIIHRFALIELRAYNYLQMQIGSHRNADAPAFCKLHARILTTQNQWDRMSLYNKIFTHCLPCNIRLCVEARWLHGEFSFFFLFFSRFISFLFHGFCRIIVVVVATYIFVSLFSGMRLSLSLNFLTLTP